MEQALVDWLRSKIQQQPGVRVGIGDDAAILSPTPGHEICVTTDMLMDHVDFIWGKNSPQLIGRKCLAVNLSDLAAMAARPLAAFVSLAIPQALTALDVQSLMQGMLDLASEFDLEIAGGDTNTHAGPLVVSVTALGETPIGQAWTRSGAKPGDRILVTGPLGGSFLEHQFTFTPRVREALGWRNIARVHAAIDISDGLGLDLSRLLRASSCGAILDESKLPLSAAAKQMSAQGSGKAPLAHALGDGEDFELLLTADLTEAAKLLSSASQNQQFLFDIGEVTAARDIHLRRPSGELAPLPASGFTHQLSS